MGGLNFLGMGKYVMEMCGDLQEEEKNFLNLL